MSNYKEISIESLNRSAVDMISNAWLLICAPDFEKESGLNAMTASWGSLGELWYKPVATVYIRPQRYTKVLVDAIERISLCFPGEEFREAMHLCGKKSGKDTDKLKECGLTSAEYDGVKYIDGSELVLICKKLYTDDIKPEKFTVPEPLSCYKAEDYHSFYILEIEKVLKRE